MKILLLCLPGIEENDGNLFPMGIGYLAGALKGFHEAKVYNYKHMKDAYKELASLIPVFQPDIIGLTCSSFIFF